MPDVPRQLPPSDQERLRTAVRRYIPGANAGGTRFAKPVKPNPFAARPHTPSGAIVGSMERNPTGSALDPIDFDSLHRSVGLIDQYVTYDAGTGFILLAEGWYSAELWVSLSGLSSGTLFRVTLSAVGEFITHSTGASRGTSSAFVSATMAPFYNTTDGDSIGGNVSVTGGTLSDASLRIVRYA